MAGFGHLPILRKLRPGSDSALARLLLQAPSELAVLESAQAARQLGDMLSGCGLEAAIQPVSEDFRPGRGELDVALFVNESERTSDVVDAVTSLLGVTPRAAADLVCASPPALLGNVSQATVAALSDRFGALGGSIVASRRAEARYDVLVGACAPRVRSRLVSTNYGHCVQAVGPDGALLIADLTHGEAETTLAELATYSAQATVVDRAFQRFDIKLDACPDTVDVRDCLIALTDMPEQIAARIAANTPIVLLSNANREHAAQALARLAHVGAEATADMTTFKRYGVRIDRASDRSAARRVIELVLGGDERVGTYPRTLARAMSLTQARWLVFELTRTGADAEVLSA